MLRKQISSREFHPILSLINGYSILSANFRLSMLPRHYSSLCHTRQKESDHYASKKAHKAYDYATRDAPSSLDSLELTTGHLPSEEMILMPR